MSERLTVGQVLVGECNIQHQPGRELTAAQTLQNRPEKEPRVREGPAREASLLRKITGSKGCGCRA